MSKSRPDIELLRYIEDHIHENLTVKHLAEQTDEDIILGKKIIDTAFQYGWESHAGFTKAFKQEFGISPSLLRMMLAEITQLGGSIEHVFLESPKQGTKKEKLFQILENKMKANGVWSDKVRQIYELAVEAYSGKKRYSGEEYITHPLNVTILLADSGADTDTICAGIFCDETAKGNMSCDLLRHNLPENVMSYIIEIEKFNIESPEEFSEGALLIKLAERLHNMRTVEFMDKSVWAKKARETLKLVLPAAAFGNQKIIDELYHLTMKYL